MSDCSTQAMKPIEPPNSASYVELEQRYQQLAQVAVHMFHLLDVRSLHPDAVIDGIEEQLEVLGVSLDD